MKVIIPMAGSGSRFAAVADQNPEYKKPKPFINIFGKPMISWAMESLPFLDLPNRPAQTEFKLKPSDLIFVILREHRDLHQLDEKLKDLFSSSINIVAIPEKTGGASITALKARDYFSDSEEIIISDPDHYFDGMPFLNTILHKDPDTAGIIPVDVPYDPEIKHSYSYAPDDKYAIKVAEKDPTLAAMGAYSNIGAYYFSTGKIFVDEVVDMLVKGETSGPEDRKEYYVAPVYQRLLNKGMKVQIALTKKACRLGTPADLEFFYANYDRIWGE